MNAAIVIATRELRDRSRLLVIAAGMAFVPFIAGWTLQDHRQIGMAAVAGFLALAYSGVVALMLGISTIGGELTEKRLSFLFARPLSPAAMWAGKTGAALSISLCAFVIVVLPTWLFAHAGWSDMWSERGEAATPLYPIVLCTVLFFGGHALSTMVRSRSPRLALDFVFGWLTLFAVVALVRPLFRVGAGGPAIRLLISIGVALLALLAVAPIWQLTRGRIDPRRNHAALSTALWSGVAVILAVAAVYVLRQLPSPPLSAFTGIYDLNQSRTGAWVFVAGEATGRGTSYLIDSATGERERLAMPPLSPYAFSPDGRVMAWLEDTTISMSFDSKGADIRDRMESMRRLKGTGAFRLYTRQLQSGAKKVATPLVVTMPGRVQLSDDGSRIAMAIGQRLEVYDVASGRLLAAAQTAAGADVNSIVFAGPEVVNFVEYGLVARAPFLRIGSLDVRTRKLTTIERPAPGRFDGATFSADGSRMYLPHEPAVLDPRTGAVLATLPVQPAEPSAGAMLRDGSLIVTRDSKLFHITAAGQIAAEVPIPMSEGYVVGQIGASKVLLEGRSGLVIVDLAAKKAGVPVGAYGPVLSRSRSAVPQFAENATFVGIGRGHKFLLWDARTGAKRPFPG